jgi:hypothetical protein
MRQRMRTPPAEPPSINMAQAWREAFPTSSRSTLPISHTAIVVTAAGPFVYFPRKPFNSQKNGGVEEKFTIKTQGFLTGIVRSGIILPYKVDEHAEKVTKDTGQNHLNPIIGKDQEF